MRRKLIDLTQEIYNGMPTFPGDLQTKIWDFHTYDETAAAGAPTGYATEGLTFSDHGPTHVDAPKHMDRSPDAPGVADLPLEYFYTEAICLDLSPAPPLASISVDQVRQAFEKSKLEFQAGETVLIYTSYYNRAYGTPEWVTRFPGLSGEATAWLVDRGAIGIGIDTPGIDAANTTTFESHKVCRDKRRIVAENLANLDQVANKRFTWVALPLKIRRATGSPVRAMAVLQED